MKTITFSPKLLAFTFFVVLLYCVPAFAQNSLIISGGTILDLSDKGNSNHDLHNSVILIQDEKIIAVGKKGEIKIPPEAKIIDARGKFILPGLIDGFAAINNQNYANAYLFMGITSIIGVSGGRRGDLFTDGDPSPTIYRLESVGEEECSNEKLLADIDSLANEGVKILLLMYQLRPSQLKIAVKRAHELGMGVIGELGHASYSEGIEAGIDAFVHSTRYSLDAAPENLIRAVADHPFSDDLDSPKWRYYKFLTELNLNDPKLLCHAQQLGRAGTFIMPTLSLLYLDLPGSKNPWNEPIAKILSPADINNPADLKTGKHNYDAPHQQAYTKLGMQMLKIEKLYKQAGAKYLAGSATDVWGTMPGISLHTELELLHRIGLTNRQAIAAATTNFAEAFHWQHAAQIKPGCIADILILEKNPLVDLNNLKEIDILILRGEIIDRESLLKKR